MGTLKNEYKSFLDDVEKNIQDEKDLTYIKERFTKFLDSMLEQMDKFMDYKKDEIEKIEKTQKELNQKLEKMQQVIDNIEKDIYSDEGFDFEIICPYCNYEFIIDVDENKTEIKCPECHNTIELDWTGNIDDEEEGGCLGQCGGCSGCGKQEIDEENEDDM